MVGPVEEVLNIPLARISLNPLQPRKHFDESKIIELSKSIQNQGVIQPLVVRVH
ncbi:MAG: ParB N-terminal domain-containing protein, partial [SAR324 cluster bacterium]|nr:ParB N-terminal domain-containing protein [SAR324 cluster bacterium]